MTPQQLPLLGTAPAAFDSIELAEANALLVAWQHRLGPLARPFGMLAYALLLDGRPVSVAISASTISATVRDGAGRQYRRGQLVELARLCAAPGYSWANRVMLRVWREVFGPRWPYWPPELAVSYSQNAHHRGGLYRFDGWERASERCGDWRGRSTWSARREPGHPAAGPKTLWLWRYSS